MTASASPAAAPRTPILVLGLGNVLCGDDGAGVAAVHALLARWAVPPGVAVVDGGTLGLDLLPLVCDAERMIIVDAVRADGPPGAPVRITGDDVAPAVAQRLSPHQVGVADLLAGASLIDRYPDEVVIVGVVPAALELGVALTPAVAAAIDELVDRVVDELRRLGAAPWPRSAPPAPVPGDAAVLAMAR